MSAKKTAKNPAGKKPGIDMELGEIVALYRIGIGDTSMGHAGLNGFSKAVGDRIMLQPFSLTDETRQRIVKNKFILKPFVDEMEKGERLRITQEVMDDPDARLVPSGDEVRQAEWAVKYEKAMKVRHTVEGLHVFQRSDLFRDNKNPIPNETEFALGPIIEGSPWREKNCQDTPAAADPVGGDDGRET